MHCRGQADIDNIDVRVSEHIIYVSSGSCAGLCGKISGQILIQVTNRGDAEPLRQFGIAVNMLASDAAADDRDVKQDLQL
jgi:hypothetical protein